MSTLLPLLLALLALIPFFILYLVSLALSISTC
jgi:hypothetical protein